MIDKGFTQQAEMLYFIIKEFAVVANEVKELAHSRTHCFAETTNYNNNDLCM